ncbi:acetylcholine receptor subunit beta-type unc-29-like [Octopus bimaculoides]|uniref:acetylcholine receptor subunit beta-type unc-29-like n=1 Tax=Octopus bimaculoides TaxID=37653 RepID=UPI0022E07AB6|nr:acetylcholine receptor subunit beta-type unc-29-like [Octopus bimaculoides]
MKLIVALIHISIASASSENIPLKTVLFSNYDKTKKPANEEDGLVYVNVSLFVENIIGLDIKQGVLASNLILGINWRDTNLKWDNSKYGKSLINVELVKIWYPNIQICNSITGKFHMDPNMAVTINSTGYIHLYIDEIFKTYCRINVQKYPFDEHECDILVCFAHLMHMEERIGAFEYDIESKSKSKQWNFKFEEIDTGKTNITAVGLTVHSKRKINSATITKIIPPIMLTFLIFAVHLLPADSGEKVSLAITVFLTNIVFLSETEKTLGNNSEEPSAYLIYLLILTFVSGCSTVVSVIICKVHAHQTGSKNNSTPEIANETNRSRNRVGVSEISDEQNMKIKAKTAYKKHVITSQKLDKISVSIIVVFLMLYIIIALSDIK